MTTDDDTIYWIQRVDDHSDDPTVEAVAKQGGSPRIIASIKNATAITTSPTAVYFVATDRGVSEIWSVEKPNGTPQLLGHCDPANELLWHDGWLWWASDAGIRRFAAP
ncbi:MAG: hypothetical protein JWO36_2912 [Myxococcales bacterium]|nr:hypothetical protein [Myxococcales bacterium]